MNFQSIWGFVGATMLLSACAVQPNPSNYRSAATSVAKADHDHDHDDDHDHDHSGPSLKHAPYGHASAQYVCNGRELLTRYSKTETVLSYDGVEINITRFPSEEGVIFSGSLGGVSVRFNGKPHSETLQLGDEIFACEKITCVPLDAPI